VPLVRVTKQNPCPVCGREKYCSVTADGGAVCCTKEPSDRPAKNGRGWWHKTGAVVPPPPPAKNGHVKLPRKRTNVRETRYPIEDPETGETVAVHGRRDYLEDGVPKKDLWWEKPDGAASQGHVQAELLPLYGTDALKEIKPHAPVVVTEGEKAADALRRLNIAAVGTVTGAGGLPCKKALAPLVGHVVCLWPDNDEGGRKHMAAVGRSLLGLGATVRVLTWPDAPEKGDAADFVAAGNGRDELNALYKAAAPVAPDGAAPSPAGLVLHRLSDLTSEDVRWLWPGRIPFGKITVLDGDPGLGKSTITLDLAARLTRGEAMPDGVRGDNEKPAGVLLLTAEDGLRDTVLPRLKALGADMTRVYALESVPNVKGEPEMPAIPRDLDLIERMVVEHGVALVIVDPLIAFLGDSSETNTWRDQDIRRALGPFALMLERTASASLLVRHLNKGSGGNPIYRGGGSIGIIGAARSGLLVQKDPDDETGVRRVLAPTKANLSAPAKAMAYRMEQAPNGSVRVVWEGETEHTAVGLLAEPLPEEERSELHDAVEFLRAELYAGAVQVEEIKRRSRAAGISERTLKRARARLGVVAEKGDGRFAPWSIKLPARYRKEVTT